MRPSVYYDNKKKDILIHKGPTQRLKDPVLATKKSIQ